MSAGAPNCPAVHDGAAFSTQVPLLPVLVVLVPYVVNPVCGLDMLF